MGKIYRTAQGRQLDIETIRLQNELVPALGNMRVNARGDQLGPGGKIIKSREMIMDEFYRTKATNNPDNIPQESSVPTRSANKKSSIPTSSKRQQDFTPGDAKPDIIETLRDTSNETKGPELKGGLAAAVARTKKTEKKVKRIE